MKKLKVNQNSNVAEVFKEFCKERHAEDKGRNYNKLQEVYANTELFDLTFCPSWNDLKLSKQKPYYKGNTLGNDFIAYSDSLIDLCLPFTSTFNKIKEYKDFENHEIISNIFIREYSPIVITGTVFTINLTTGTTMNCPFTVHTDIGKIIINLVQEREAERTFGLPFMKNVGTGILGLISATLEIITNLPKHSVASDKPTKAEYYPRRNADTIKVIRPIYYVMDKSEEKKPNQLKLIKPIGHLEFSHAFKVRCHYRRINENSLGLNRNGERIVKGYTFVKEYIKGEGELVKKIRILK